MANSLKVTATRVSVRIPPYPEKVFVKNDLISPDSFYYKKLLDVDGVVDSGVTATAKPGAPRVPIPARTPV